MTFDFAFTAASLLADARPGSFVVRNSTSLPGAFALAIRVSQLPSNRSSKGNRLITYIVVIVANRALSTL